MRSIILLLPALLLGCQSGPDTERAARAGIMASRIIQDPSDAELVFAAEDVDSVEYQGWLYEIAADPVKTEVYLEYLQAGRENPYTPDIHTTPRPSAGDPPGNEALAP